MKRLMRICIVLTAIAMVAAPALAEVQNVKVSGDIEVMGIYRDDFDLVDADTVNNDDQQAWYQSIARIQIDADLTDNVSTCVRILNERDWDVDDVADSDMDLDIANITMKEFFYAPLTLIIGRQELRYGNSMVIGNVSQNTANFTDSITANNYSARNAFDAIRGIVELDNVTIDIFTAKIDEAVGTTPTAPVGSGTVSDDNDLYGIDVSTTIGDVPVAGYVVYANDNSDPGAADANEIWTLGVRGAKALTDALDANLEVAVQTGKYTAIKDQSAWALDAGLDYTMEADMNPVLGIAYSYRSGASASAAATDDQEAWVPLYEDQTNGLIADYLFDGINDGVNSNCHIVNVSAVVEPLEDLTVSIDYYQFVLDEKFSEAETAVGSLSGKSLSTDDDLGSEMDIALNYAYTEDVNLGLTAAWFMPGDVFEGSNDDTATEVVGSINVGF
ncbi:MAG: alginate export family protein [Candidatus Omnitrophica bacterium]|nr:alginate export family protein [Candidatus Omnitrophota bacterium]